MEGNPADGLAADTSAASYVPIGPPAAPPRAVSHLELVEAAVLAPSPDNNQPWHFVSRGDRLLVYLDGRRTLPSDVNGMFDLTGLGAAVENICIAARELGCEAKVSYGTPVAGAADTEPVATLTFGPGGKSDPLFRHLEDRCTCRKLYSTGPLDDRRLQELEEAAADFSEVQLDWMTDRPRIRAMARVVAACDLIRFQYEPFHNELFRQLRFSTAEAESTRDGLDLRTLELPPGAGLLLRALRPWSRMKWVHRLGLGRSLTVPSAVAVCRSAALGVLTVPEPTSRSFLRGGRALQRLWLAASAEGLALQPLGSPAIFFAHLRQLEGQKLSERHRRRLQRLIARFESLVPRSGGRVLLMLFRLGESSPPSFMSLRRPAEEVAQVVGAP